MTTKYNAIKYLKKQKEILKTIFLNILGKIAVTSNLWAST